MCVHACIHTCVCGLVIEKDTKTERPRDKHRRKERLTLSLYSKRMTWSIKLTEMCTFTYLTLKLKLIVYNIHQEDHILEVSSMIPVYSFTDDLIHSFIPFANLY